MAETIFKGPGAPPRVYLAGPMTGYDDYNYPAFFFSAAQLRARGYDVYNPADAFGGDTTLPTTAYTREELAELLKCDFLVLLPGWENSKGCAIEIQVARGIGIPVLDIEFQSIDDSEYRVAVYRGHDPNTCGILFCEDEQKEREERKEEPPLPPRAAILDEAKHLITGDRNNTYGPPTQDFSRSAGVLTALGYRRLDTDDKTLLPIMGSDIAIMVGAVKTSRLMHSRHKRDSWVDTAGYAGCGYECSVEEANENE